MTQGILQVNLLTDITQHIKPKYPIVTADHVTLFYGVDLKNVPNFLLNQKVNVSAILEYWDDQIQAIGVVLPFWLNCQNASPHITVSHKIDVEPFDSNRLLAEYWKHNAKVVERELWDIPGVIVFRPFKKPCLDDGYILKHDPYGEFCDS